MPSTYQKHTADQLAAIDALYRFAPGIDLRDAALLSSAFMENAVSDFGPAAAKAGFEFPVLEGREVIVETLFGASIPPTLSAIPVWRSRVTRHIWMRWWRRSMC
ncbi:hypothetical protein [Pseudomonas sp. M47T1]|uniref:hypothetical protein n=1 Tax=Pseudomonas sp. M47T1 TaxID=1179778 RepID=UPI0002EC404B